MMLNHTATENIHSNVFKRKVYTMSNSRFYLSCPYSEKDECKELGGRWDNIERKWFVPEDADRDDFKQWWPGNVSDINDFLGN
jgi:hypothetical protein